MGSGTAVATGDIITAAKMNLKLETIVDADLNHSSGIWTIGVDGAGQDIIIYTDATGRKITFDSSDSQFEFDDNCLLAFGDDDDVSIKWDTTKLLVLPLTNDTGIIQIGDGTLSMDLEWFGSISTRYILFDVGDDRLTLEDIDLYLGDNDMLVFGDGANVVVKWDATKLMVEAPVASFLKMDNLSLEVDGLLTDKTTATVESTADVHTITAAELITRIYHRDCNGAAREDTTDTAAAIVAAIVGAKVGQTFLWFVKNTTTADFTLTIAGGTGVTITGTATIAQNYTKIFLVRLDNVTPAAEAVSMYSIGTLLH